MTWKVTHTDERAQPKRKKRETVMVVEDNKDFWKVELAKWPRIAIPRTDSNGVTQFHTEFIPELLGRFAYWWRGEYFLWRTRLNWPIYYWHVRHWHSPYIRKRYDLMFAAHVICDHDGKPTDPVERRHYYWLQLQYGVELDYFKPVFEALKEDMRTYWANEYVQSYADRWIRRPYPELITLFHGLNAPDYFDYLDYEDHHQKKELRKVLAQYAARRRWSKAKSKQN